jgi:hypothetical protein
MKGFIGSTRLQPAEAKIELIVVYNAVGKRVQVQVQVQVRSMENAKNAGSSRNPGTRWARKR